ncbi:hypothetical protein BTVI_153010 [Pitangus sulphuratus]|nr:hypothetical protein BTVI_153010 [Pitangus sulphuratus]
MGWSNQALHQEVVLDTFQKPPGLSITFIFNGLMKEACLYYACYQNFSQYSANAQILPLDYLNADDTTASGNLNILNSFLVTSVFMRLTQIKTRSNNTTLVILKGLADLITKPLLMIFECSGESGEVLADWKLVNIVLIFKKGEKEDPGNYRLVSLTSIPCKVMEKIILGGLKGILGKFANNTKLGGAVNSLKGREALQRDLNKSERWVITNHMTFNKGKCWILDLGWGNPGCVYRLGNEMAESSKVERDLGVLVDGKLMSSSALAARGPTVS